MRTDIYLKVILSIIAGCLLISELRHFQLFPTAKANDTGYYSNGFISTNSDGSINVRILDNTELDVVIKGIETYDKLKVNLAEISTSDELDVNIDEVGGSFVSMGGPIKVVLN